MFVCLLACAFFLTCNKTINCLKFSGFSKEEREYRNSCLILTKQRCTADIYRSDTPEFS